MEIEQILQPISTENQTGNGHFCTSKFEPFLLTMLWFLVVCVVKMLSDRKRKVVEKIGETGSEEMEVDIFSSRP